MQEIFFGDLSGRHHKALATHNTSMLSVEATILGQSNEPNEILRLDVLVIEYVSQSDFLLAIFSWWSLYDRRI